MNRLQFLFCIIASFLFSSELKAQADLNYIQMDSVKIPYKSIGEGRSLVFIEDGFENSESFVEYLQKDGNKVILPMVEPDLSVEEKAVQMMTVASSISRDPITIIGSVEHADLAVKMSFFYPANVNRIILVGSEKPIAEVHCPVTFVSPSKKALASMNKVKDEISKEACLPVNASKKLLFDLSHNQCKDVFKGYETYPYLLSAYERMLAEIGDSSVDAVLMTSPLNKDLQKNLLESERKALVNYVAQGHALVFFIDDAHRVNWEAYGAQDVV